MNNLSARIGFWASVAGAMAFVIYLVSFGAILVVNKPLYIWSDYADFLVYNATSNPLFARLAQASMLLFATFFVVILAVLQEQTDPERRVLARIAAYFGVLFAGAVSIHYFSQISVVRISLAAGQTAGLEHFIQANPYSYSSGINMLGWTLFLGTASLFAAPLFPGNGLQTAIRWAFWVNAFSCLLGGVAFVFDWVIVVGITINLGMGGALTLLTVLLAIYFRRRSKWGSGT